MSIQINKKKDYILVTLQGKYTLTNSQKLLDRLSENVAKNSDYVLDLAQVEFMDSAGLGAIVAFYKLLKTNESTLIIKSLNEDLKILFEITRATKFFKVIESEKALNELDSIGVGA
jgi:anti-sigma B factor antagonist